ncbi:MAG: Crp/Fnr family transcriptional regulator [Clostridia bacterium]|nr:Crp/Fnr family transcriptional regulator [Clostridia bacterium]
MPAKTKRKVADAGCLLCNEGFCAVVSLSQSQISLLQNNSHEKWLARGEHLSHQGMPTSHIIYLRKGLVMEYYRDDSQRNRIIKIVKSGSYLGLHSLFSEGVNHYSYKALADLHVCLIEVEAFKNLVHTNNVFAYEILASVSRDSLSGHHRFLNINAKQTYGKVADVLLYFARIVFGNNTFELPLTRREMGSMIGITRESTAKALAKFQSEGFIVMEGNLLNIIMPDQLETISRTG